MENKGSTEILKIKIITKVYGHIVTRVELASWFRLSVYTLNIICEEP
jgi:hypothetical protein